MTPQINFHFSHQIIRNTQNQENGMNFKCNFDLLKYNKTKKNLCNVSFNCVCKSVTGFANGRHYSSLIPWAGWVKCLLLSLVMMPLPVMYMNMLKRYFTRSEKK